MIMHGIGIMIMHATTPDPIFTSKQYSTPEAFSPPLVGNGDNNKVTLTKPSDKLTGQEEEREREM
jgi:hypothetical protein